MTLAQFNSLPNSDKAKSLNKYGVYLAERTVSGNRIYLYAINHFYVELEHHLADINNGSITINAAFEDLEYLDAYPDQNEFEDLSFPTFTV